MSWNKVEQAEATLLKAGLYESYILRMSPDTIKKSLGKAKKQVQKASKRLKEAKKSGAGDDAEEAKAMVAKAQLGVKWYSAALTHAKKIKSAKDKDAKKRAKEAYAQAYKKYKDAVKQLKEKYMMRDL